jgi:hypothetical protein
MLNAATGRHRLDFVEKLCDNVVAVKSPKESSASASVIDSTAAASVGFLLVAVSKSEAQLSILANFRNIVTSFSTHALPAARKLVSWLILRAVGKKLCRPSHGWHASSSCESKVIRLVDCWVERGLGAEPIVPILTKFAIGDSDATVACAALDSLSSEGVLDGLGAPALTSVLQAVAAHHASR